MKHVVISAIFRPHITDEGTHCWCRPTVEECEDHGRVVCHRDVERMPDNRPRMASFSEQRADFVL